MAIPSPPDKEGQLAKLYARLSIKTGSDEAAMIADMFDDALQMCLDYTHGKLTTPVLIQAKRFAVVMYNQQANE